MRRRKKERREIEKERMRIIERKREKKKWEKGAKLMNLNICRYEEGWTRKPEQDIFIILAKLKKSIDVIINK